jgi:predicted DNA-binding transcriptional regulator AlpA
MAGVTSRDQTSYSERRSELLDKRDAQAALGHISRATLDRLRRRGELPVVRIGRRVFFHADDIAAFVQKRRGVTTQ